MRAYNIQIFMMILRIALSRRGTNSVAGHSADPAAGPSVLILSDMNNEAGAQLPEVVGEQKALSGGAAAAPLDAGASVGEARAAAIEASYTVAAAGDIRIPVR